MAQEVTKEKKKNKHEHNKSINDAASGTVLYKSAQSYPRAFGLKAENH
jgi:hypothetical protein